MPWKLWTQGLGCLLCDFKSTNMGAHLVQWISDLLYPCVGSAVVTVTWRGRHRWREFMQGLPFCLVFPSFTLSTDGAVVTVEIGSSWTWTNVMTLEPKYVFLYAETFQTAGSGSIPTSHQSLMSLELSSPCSGQAEEWGVGSGNEDRFLIRNSGWPFPLVPSLPRTLAAGRSLAIYSRATVKGLLSSL